MKILDANRLFPADHETRSIAARLYETIKDLPIISPHGHTDPRWFALNEPFPNPTALLIQPDHYIFRMLYSQGVSLESLGIPQLDGKENADPREVWRIFAKHYYLFRGTPTRLWLDYTFENQFGLTKRLSPENADEYYDIIAKKLQTPEFRPRALFEQFNIDVLSTTDTPLDTLEYHKAIRDSGWKGRIIPTFRPDSVIDAEYAGFLGNIEKLGEITGEDIGTWKGYLNALRNRRAFFKSMGATATDHGHLTAQTADLDPSTAAALYGRILSGRSVPEEQQIFQAQMLTEMAGMSVEDGLTMQLHPGSVRNHNRKRLRKIRPRQRRRHALAHRVRPRPPPPAQQVRQRPQLHLHPLHPRRDRLLAANSPRSPATIPRSNSARPGGSTTHPRA